MHRHFEDELDTLRSQLIRMGSLVDEQIETAIRALNESNIELAKFVITREERVNELDLTIDGQCQRIFALAQPVCGRSAFAACRDANEWRFRGALATLPSISQSASRHWKIMEASSSASVRRK